MFNNKCSSSASTKRSILSNDNQNWVSHPKYYFPFKISYDCTTFSEWSLALIISFNVLFVVVYSILRLYFFAKFSINLIPNLCAVCSVQRVRDLRSCNHHIDRVAWFHFKRLQTQGETHDKESKRLHFHSERLLSTS